MMIEGLTRPCPNGHAAAEAWYEVELDDNCDVIWYIECSACAARTAAYWPDDQAVADWNAGKFVEEEG